MGGAREGSTRLGRRPTDGNRNTKDGEVRVHSSRSVLVMVVTVIASASMGPIAGADTSAATSTDPTGAHVELQRDNTWVEVTPHDGLSTTTGCVRRWIPSGEFQLRKTPTGDYREVPMTVPRPGPEFSVYQVFCDTTYVGAVWLRPQQFGVNAFDIAERLVRDLPYPPATVGTNPQTRGLTGLETWFWVAGYTSAPLADTVTRFGLRVDVEAVPASVSWDYGDGTTARDLGLGSAPPQRSTVAHTFEVRARPAFAVRALVMLSVRWRLNGGPWQPLDPVVRTATRAYPVVESRAALVPDGA